MDAQQPDMLSSLHDLLLILIISLLPFKEAVRTSVLSKRWRNVCHQTRNIEFHETEFVDLAGPEETKSSQRILFIRFMCEWVSRFSGEEIDTFEVKLSKPVGFQREIASLITFAASRHVKNLVLDFSDHVSRTSDAENCPTVVDLPPRAYEQTALESLKLYACGLVASGFKNLGSLRNLSLGWVELSSFSSLLLNSPLLETLRLTKCWNVDLAEITGRNEELREVIIEDCVFTGSFFYFDVPNVKVFKYSGDFRHFYFERVKKMVEEVYLDFGLETEFEENGEVLCNLLHDFTSARSLTVCTYLLQVVPSGVNVLSLESPLEARNLILRTTVHPYEFVGIRFMLRSCPDLENLTFEIVPPRILEDYFAPFMFKPEEFWEENISYRCMRKTLKVVVVKGFQGAFYELHVLQYLLRFGRVMQRLELHIDQTQRIMALAGADMVNQRFPKASKNLEITIHH